MLMVSKTNDLFQTLVSCYRGSILRHFRHAPDAKAGILIIPEILVLPKL